MFVVLCLVLQQLINRQIGCLHAVAGFARVYITDGGLMNSFAISSALFCIVMTSVVTGTVLPFGLAMAGIDPANAGTTIQVRTGHAMIVSDLQPFPSALWSTSVGNTGSSVILMPWLQVWCDITGCLITCATCRLILEQASSIFVPV